jgi:hypothetical protein
MSSDGADGLLGFSAVSTVPPHRPGSPGRYREWPTPGLPMSGRIAGHSVRNAGPSPAFPIHTIFARFQHFSPEIHRQRGIPALHLSGICYLGERVVGCPVMRGPPARHVVFRGRIAIGERYERSRRPSIAPSDADRYSLGNPPVPATLLNQTLACNVDLRSQVTQASWKAFRKNVARPRGRPARATSEVAPDRVLPALSSLAHAPSAGHGLSCAADYTTARSGTDQGSSRSRWVASSR